jgi:DNA-binding MarR family transcriptional regulator
MCHPIGDITPPGPAIDKLDCARASGNTPGEGPSVSNTRDLEDDIVAAIRRIIRAIDLQSRRLVDRHDLTGPQLAILREVDRLEAPSTGSLARAVHLSQPTVTGVLNRLEKRGLVRRDRSEDDRRSVVISLTRDGASLLSDVPSQLQDRFRDELARLEDWERHSLLASLQRIASMMDAETLDAAPILDTGPVDSPPDDEPDARPRARSARGS